MVAHRRRRILELRVHGVGNTSPADVLGADVEPELVAGDRSTGFYRAAVKQKPAAVQQEPGFPVIVEAYNWGPLTSGERAETTTRRDLQRALWLVLLPFTFANVAFWSRADAPADPDEDRLSTPRGVSAYLVRVLCLSLTGTLVLAAAGAGVDLVGWQCRGDCLSKIPYAGFLGAGWWSQGARPLTVGLLAPLAVLATLWWLGRRSFRYEAEVPEPAPGSGENLPRAGDTAMETADFWRGEGQVRRLALLHVAVGVVAASGVTLGGALTLGVRGGDAWWLVAGIWSAVLLAASLGVALWQLAHRSITRRDGSDGYGVMAPLALFLAFAGLAGTVVCLLLPGREPVAGGALPGYGGTITWLFTAQFLAIVAVAGLARRGWLGAVPAAAAVVALVLLRFAWLVGLDLTSGWRFALVLIVLVAALLVALGRPGRGSGDSLSGPAWGGRGAAVLLGAGWLAGVLFSAAVLIRLVDWLNAGRPASSPSSPILVPTPLAWSAAGLVVVAVALAGVLAWTWVWRGLLARGIWRDVASRYGDAGRPLSRHELRRAWEVAAWRALRQIVERHGLTLVGWLAIVAGLLAAAGSAGSFTALSPAELSDDSAVGPVLAWMTDFGSVLAVLLLAGLAMLGFLAYRNDTARRTVGIVWDVGTFWPRAAHPFAPPCYAERAVPHLITRICNQTEADGVILAGHSQGAVIAVATVLQLPQPARDRVHLLTFGTQLNRLYGRVFPGFFGPGPLLGVAGRLGGAVAAPRWRSFYRLADPIGYAVDVSAPPGVEGAGPWIVDHPGEGRSQDLPDPEALRPAGGEVLDPVIRNHSGYQLDPIYLATRDQAAEDLLGETRR